MEDLFCNAKKIHETRTDTDQKEIQIKTADRDVCWYRSLSHMSAHLLVWAVTVRHANTEPDSYKQQEELVGPQSVICSWKPPTTSTPLKKSMPWEGRHSWHWLIMCVCVCGGVGRWSGGGFVVSRASLVQLTPWTDWLRETVMLGWVNGGLGGFHALWKLLYSRGEKK